MGKKKKHNSSPKENQNLLEHSSDFINETLDKQNYKICLTQADIANIARFRFGWYGEGDVIFEVIGLPQLHECLAQYIIKLLEGPDKRSLILIINLNNHWVTLTVAYRKPQFYGYYIDSLKARLPDDIKERLQHVVVIFGHNIEIYSILASQQRDNYNCGIFALINAKIYHHYIKMIPDTTVIERKLRYESRTDVLNKFRVDFAETLRNSNPAMSCTSSSGQSSDSSGNQGEQSKDHCSEPTTQDSPPSGFETNIKTMIRARKLSIENREILIAAGNNDLKELKRLMQLPQADIHFVDGDDKEASCHDAHSDNSLIVDWFLNNLKDSSNENDSQQSGDVFNIKKVIRQRKIYVDDPELFNTLFRGNAINRAIIELLEVDSRTVEDRSRVQIMKKYATPTKPDRNFIVNSNDMEESIKLIKMGVENRKLLIAIGNGNLTEVKKYFKAKQVDVNFADRNGNKALHYAVQSGKVKVVKLLLGEVEQICEKNKECKTPLDIARENKSQNIIEVLVKKIISCSNDIIVNTPVKTYSSNKTRKGDSTAESFDPELSPAEKEIKKTKHKIEYCLESLKKSNGYGSSTSSQISAEQAKIFIEFVEALALAGSGNEHIKSELKKHFSLNYTENDRLRIERARNLLLHSSINKICEPKDVSKFIEGDEESFFKELEKYLEYLVIGLKLADIFFAMQRAVTQENEERDNLNLTETVIWGEGYRERFRDLNNEEAKNLSCKKDIVLECYREVCCGQVYNEKIINMIKQDFSQHSTDKDKDEIIAALKNVDELKEYFSQRIKTIEVKCKPNRLDSFLKIFENKADFETSLTKTDSSNIIFLSEEFEELIKLSFNSETITLENQFNFLLNFYPVFQIIKDNKCALEKKVTQLRNILTHEFYKCGDSKFKDEICRMRPELLRYCYAKDVHDKLYSDTKEMRKELESLFMKKFKSVAETEYYLSEADAIHYPEWKMICPYLFEKSSDFKTLVNRYLYFIILMDNKKVNERDISLRTYRPNKKTVQFSGLDTRLLFDKFCKVITARILNEELYLDMKEDLRENLTTDYEIQGHHFDKIFKFYEESNNKSDQHSNNNSINNATSEISSIIHTLTRIKDQYNCSIKSIISMLECLKKRNASFHIETSDKLQQDIASSFACLSLDDISIKISNDSLFDINIYEAVSNMLNIFYTPFNLYQIDLDFKVMFNDESFLDYLVVKVTKDLQIEDLVEPYLKFTLTIDQTHIAKLDGGARSKMFEQFCRLKELYKNKNKNKDYYDKEKQELAQFALDHGVVNLNKHLYKLCLESDYKIETLPVKPVKVIIKYLTDIFRSCKVSNKVISSLFVEVVEKEGKVNLEQIQNLLSDIHKSKHDKIVNKLNELYSVRKLDENKLSIALQGIGSFEVSISKVVTDMLETFEGKLQVEKDKYKSIEKLVKQPYLAPYIARLITTVRSDACITKTDLVCLIQNLLTEKDGSYIKHFNELLKIKSSKLNLYDEFCDKILDSDLDIQSMSLIFEDVEHVKEILYVLNYRIDHDPQVGKDDKTVQLTKKVLKLVHSLTSKYFQRYDDEAVGLMFLEVQKTYKKLNCKRLIETTDLSDVEYTLKRVQLLLDPIYHSDDEIVDSIVELPRRDPVSMSKADEALKILELMPDTMHDLENFVVLYYKAKAYYITKQYTKSYEVWDNLYKTMVKYALSSDSFVNTHTVEIYENVMNSKKYTHLKDLLSTKYGDLNLRFNIIIISCQKARTMISSGISSDDVKNNELYWEGVAIFNVIHRYYEYYLQKYKPLNLRSLNNPGWRYLDWVYNEIIGVTVSEKNDGNKVYQRKLHYMQEALNHYQDMLAMLNQEFNLIKYGKSDLTETEVSMSIQNILYSYHKIPW